MLRFLSRMSVEGPWGRSGKTPFPINTLLFLTVRRILLLFIACRVAELNATALPRVLAKKLKFLTFLSPPVRICIQNRRIYSRMLAPLHHYDLKQ